MPRSFWSKVQLEPPPAHAPELGDCWGWTRAKTRGGYSSWGAPGTSSGPVAHKQIYIATVGPIPDGLQLDHLCRLTRCVRPSHLEPVTSKENNRRSREARGIADRCNAGHSLLGGPDVRFTADGERVCLICREVLRMKGYARQAGEPDTEFMLTRDVCALTGLTQPAIRDLGQNGLIAGKQIPASQGRKRWLFYADSARAFAATMEKAA